MPLSPKLIAVATSAAVLIAGGATAAAVNARPAPEVTAVPAALIETPQTVEVLVWADGAAQRVAATEPTVASALATAGISLGEHDRVAPSMGSQLTVGDSVTVSRVTVSQETQQVALAFASSQVEDAKLAKGQTKVTTKGVEGLREDVVQTITVDGQVEGTQVVSQNVVREPVTQVTAVGTKKAEITSRSAERTPAPKPTATAAPKASTTPKPAAPKPATPKPSAPKPDPAPEASQPPASGGALDLSRAAMWDRIAKCESTNRWNINTGNGYYGGLQFNLATWRSVGGTDFAAYPHQATREEQITVANRLYAKRGTQPWSCA